MKNIKFENLCKLTQKEMKEYLKTLYPNAREKDGYLYIQGTYPVMLLAHMDTVHKETPKEFIYDGDIISSPQGIGGDDRCGIYMINEIKKKYDCSILFTEDEEIGCIGARKFAKSTLATGLGNKFNYLIQLDRRGNDDAVFYDCDNKEFTEFITEKDWDLAQGSYTDICEIAPILNTAAVNFSCGYYHEHHLNEYVNLKEMETNIQRVLNTLERTDINKKFEFVEKILFGRFRDYDNWYGNEYDDYETKYYISYYKNDQNCIEEISAISPEEAVGKFLIDNTKLTFSDIVEILDEWEYLEWNEM